MLWTRRSVTESSGANLRFDVEGEYKTNTNVRNLHFHYEILMFSLRSLGPVCRKRKLKDRIGWIEETNSDPYESVIPGIETLHFTSPGARTSIAFLGRKSDVPSRFVRKE
jgi:hypothetical protein